MELMRSASMSFFVAKERIFAEGAGPPRRGLLARSGETRLRASIARAGGALEPVQRLLLVGADDRAFEVRDAEEIAHFIAAAPHAFVRGLARALDDRGDVAAAR